jgi:serine/alanine adding enzyme
MSRILINDEINTNYWDEFILKNENSSVFHTREFHKLNSNSMAIAIEEDNEIKAVTILTINFEKGIKKVFTNRAILYDFPLYNNNDYLKTLLNFIIKKLIKECIYLEIRNYSNKNLPKIELKNLGFTYLDYLNIRIPLENLSISDVLSKMSYNRRREINLGIKKGVEWAEIHDEMEVTKLYELLKKLYAEKIKLPIPNIDYFKKMVHFNCSKVIAVKFQNEIIGGAFCLYSEGKGIFTTYYFSNERFSNLHPTHLCIYATIEFAISKNLKYIDLMGAGIKSEEYGVRNYKKQFGGDLYESGRFRYIFKPRLFQLATTIIDFQKKLKNIKK